MKKYDCREAEVCKRKLRLQTSSMHSNNLICPFIFAWRYPISLMLFSQNPIKKKGNKPLDSRQLSTQINNKRHWAAFATKLQEHERPKQQLMKEGSSWCVCTLYKRHRNTSVAVSQKSKKHQKAYWEDKAAFPFTTVDNGTPSPYLLPNGSINLQKQNYELECSNAC